MVIPEQASWVIKKLFVAREWSILSCKMVLGTSLKQLTVQYFLNILRWNRKGWCCLGDLFQDISLFYGWH